MRSYIVGFAIAVGALIVAVSFWVVTKATNDTAATKIVFSKAPIADLSFFDRLTVSDPLAGQPAEPTATDAASTEVTDSSSILDTVIGLLPTSLTGKTSTPAPVVASTTTTVTPVPVQKQEDLTPQGEAPAKVTVTTPAEDVLVDPVPATPAPIAEAPTPETPAVTDAVEKPSLLERLLPNSTTTDTGLSFAERLARGKAAFAAGSFREAVTEFAAAAKLDAESSEALIRLAEAQLYDKSYEQALANLTAVEKLDATNPSIFVLRGRIAIRMGRFPAAVEHFAKAGEKASFWQGVMDAFYDRADEAKQLFAAVVQQGGLAANQAQIFLDAYAEYAKFPDSPKSHLDTLIARSLIRIGEHDLAAEKLRIVVTEKPDYLSAWTLLGFAEYHRGGYDKAKSALETAYRLNGADSKTQYLLGETLFVLKKYTEAERYLLLAKENRYPNQRELAKALADLYFAMNRYAEAADNYAAMVATSKTSPDDFVRPVYLYLDKLKDGQAAWLVAKLAMKNHPESAMSWNLAGWVSIANGYLPEAREYLAKAESIDPNLPAVQLNLGRYFEGTGDIESARTAYQKAYDLDRDGSVGNQAAERFNALLKK